MFINFADTTLKRVIIHKIEKKKKGEETSNVICESDLFGIDDEAKGIIKQRITDACGARSKSFILQIADTSAGSFFDISKDIWDMDEEKFIEKSQNIAFLLGDSQRRANIPGGFILIIDGIENDKGFKFVIVIKAELQEAFTTTFDDKTSKNQLSVLKNIFLSPAKKFFKIGIMKQSVNREEVFPNSDYACLIHDDQFSSNNRPAEFFYEKFLGFSADRNAKIITKEWYEDTKKVIIENSPSEEKKQENLSALKVVMRQDSIDIIDPREFGENYLDGVTRRTYASAILMQDKYSHRFEKNTEIMGRELEQRKIKFREKIVVQGPEDNFDDHVHVITDREEIQELLEDDLINYTILKIDGKPNYRK